MAKKIEHYLITFELENVHLHGYVMAPHKGYVNNAMDRMTQIAEKSPYWSRFPVILVTRLSTAKGRVREVICKFKGIEKSLKDTKDYHFTVWTMPKDDPEDTKLMELH